MTATVETPYFTLRELAERYRLHHSTIHRWIRLGVEVHGVRIRLQAYRVGGTWRVSREALERFMAACNRPRDPGVK